MKKKLLFHRQKVGFPSGKYLVLSDGNNAEFEKKNISINLSGLYKRNGKKWLDNFSTLISKFNKSNQTLFWWAYVCTAKNLLSSPLGERYVQVRAVCEILSRENVKTLHIVGATPGQMESLATALSKQDVSISGAAWKLRHCDKLLKYLITIIRQPVFLYQMIIRFRLTRSINIKKDINLCMFTYIDGDLQDSKDRYYGKLPDLLNKYIDKSSMLYLAYVYKPYELMMQQANVEKTTVPYMALFSLLRMSDYFWVSLHVSIMLWNNLFYKKRLLSDKYNSYTSLINESLLHDITTGSYVTNLLIYRSVIRFINDYRPTTLVYPYENKSLEKMIIIAAKNCNHATEIIGYQHTSITPRHITLLFMDDEAQYTPLPDKIITVGNVTREYLEIYGNYPKGIFATGCALRQSWIKSPIRKNAKGATIKVLLALSSSKKELIHSIVFFKKVMKIMPNIELGVRPHINFPIRLLSNDEIEWINCNATDLTGTSLFENLKWCDVTVYVSSTVALEVLMIGKPVINISIGDIVSPDPVLGDCSFHWNAFDELELMEILMHLQEMSDSDYEKNSRHAIDYVSNYFVPVNNSALLEFCGHKNNL